jgi:hypothetical protein
VVSCWQKEILTAKSKKSKKNINFFYLFDFFDFAVFPSNSHRPHPRYSRTKPDSVNAGGGMMRGRPLEEVLAAQGADGLTLYCAGGKTIDHLFLSEHIE